MTFQKKRSRFRTVLVVAVALGCSSASISGVLGALAIQQGSSVQAISA
jgi:hypothetical protein